jgi:hypothetical protein
MPQPHRNQPDPLTEPAEGDDRWWIIVVSDRPELGSGRYGVWEDKPQVNISKDGNTAVISSYNDEADVYVNLRNVLTISVGKIEHFDAQPVGSNAPDITQG